MPCGLPQSRQSEGRGSQRGGRIGGVVRPILPAACAAGESNESTRPSKSSSSIWQTHLRECDVDGPQRAGSLLELRGLYGVATQFRNLFAQADTREACSDPRSECRLRRSLIFDRVAENFRYFFLGTAAMPSRAPLKLRLHVVVDRRAPGLSPQLPQHRRLSLDHHVMLEPQ